MPGPSPGTGVTARTVVSTNVLGTWNVLQAAVEAGVERFVGLSSINAQGSSGGWRETAYLPIDDDYPHHPMTPYQLSKHLMEEVCRSFSERYRLVTICLRPVFVVHPANPHLDGLGTAAFVEPWRDEYWAYVDVRDVADAVVRSLQVQGVRHDRFLLSARDTSVPDETRALVEREYPAVPWPTVDPERYFAGDPFRSLIDCSHAHEVLGLAASSLVARRGSRQTQGDSRAHHLGRVHPHRARRGRARGGQGDHLGARAVRPRLRHLHAAPAGGAHGRRRLPRAVARRDAIRSASRTSGSWCTRTPTGATGRC